MSLGIWYTDANSMESIVYFSLVHQWPMIVQPIICSNSFTKVALFLHHNMSQNQILPQYTLCCQNHCLPLGNQTLQQMQVLFARSCHIDKEIHMLYTTSRRVYTATTNIRRIVRIANQAI